MIISRLRSICEDAANGPKSGTVHATDLTAHDPTINRADAVSLGNLIRTIEVALSVVLASSTPIALDL